MNTWILTIAVIAVIGIIVLAAWQLTIKPEVKPEVTTEEISILEDQIHALTAEQLAAISTELTDFITNTESSIASDTSMFYYE